ncbi:MAG: hypothetical protein RLY86_199 [Pseudomonadota bacterium]
MIVRRSRPQEYPTGLVGRIGLRGLQASAVALLAGLAAFPVAGASAQTAAPAPVVGQGDAPLEEIVVVGSRGKPRTVLESAVPVDVISAADITRAATLGGEVGQVLQTLVPSVNFPRQSNSGTADSIRSAQIRGMSPDQVLVLVNGKRRHSSAVLNIESKIGRGTAPVDLNTIPVNAVERVEVLRDGAGALYGSDAVAGVVNLVLKGGAEGGQASASFGLHHTDFDPLDDSITDGQTYVANADYGFGLGDGGFIRIGGEYTARNATKRAAPGELPFFEANTAANRAAAAANQFNAGDPDVDGFNSFVNAEVPLSGGLVAYGFGTAGYRESVGSAFFRFPDGFQAVPAIFPNGYRPETTGENLDLAATGGLRGEAAGWSWDAGLTYGMNEFDSGVRRSLNPSLGTDSPTEFHLATFRYDQASLNLDATREFQAGLAGPLLLAVGAEARREWFETTAGDRAGYVAGPRPLAIGAQAGPGLAPEDTADADRDVIGFYADLEGQVVERLTLGIAGRYEHYSDFGDTLTGKLSGRFALTDGFALRGAVSSNVRAPSLAQTAFQFSSINLGDGGALTTIRTVAVDSPIGRLLGAEDLEEESAFNTSAGITGDLGNGLTVTVDLFRIEVEDRVTLSERFSGVGALVRSRLGIQGVESVNFFTNAVDTTTEGVDVVATWTGEVADGRLDLTAAYNYAKTEIDRVKATPAVLVGLGGSPTLVGTEERNTLEEAAPRDKLILSASYDRDALGLLLRGTRHGETTRVFDFGGGFTPTQTYGAEWAIDLEVSYDVTEAVTIAVGGNNVLDNYPDRSIADISYFGNFPYDVLSPIGFNGAYYYVRTQVRF